MDSDFAPLGSVLITVMVMLLGAMILFFAMLARRGKPDRNFTTADRQDLHSLIWTSEETWQASHRANAPWLFAAASGPLAGGAVMIGAMISLGAGSAMTFVLTVLCVVLFWTLACCTAAGIAGRIAAKQVLTRNR
ncbi:hypothetical protein [Brevibacterium album]|uniref:hypothetical protein n=1 Tax=Brevibacterium album TaxID=417948 RepID=UPI0004074FA6|nr:hypothetical protein [Brevibacterium album]